jgi:hypothetical protein
VDAWKIARTLIGPESDWLDGYTSEDVLALARWIDGTE